MTSENEIFRYRVYLHTIDGGSGCSHAFKIIPCVHD